MASAAEKRARSSLVEAENFVQQGEKCLKKFSFFSNQKYEDAAEAFAEAANRFKVASRPEDAGKYYCRAAELNLQLNDNTKAMMLYKDAGKMYKIAKNFDDMEKVYGISINMYHNNDKLATAAKLLGELGDEATKENDMQKGIDYYMEAAEDYVNTDNTAHAGSMKQKAAHNLATLEEYQRAIDLYEEVAMNSLDGSLSKYKCKDLYYYALLCHMPLATKSGDFESIENAMEKYCELYGALKQSREFKLIQNLVEAAKDRDLEKYSTHSREYDAFKELPTWEATILHLAKSYLADQEQADDDDLGHAIDDDDLS